MKTYNLIYDKSKDLTIILGQLEGLGVTVNQTFSSLGMINVSSVNEDFSTIEGIIGFEEDVDVNPEVAFEWHQLRVGSRALPVKENFIPKNYGNGVSIYLIDSGITHSHPEFEDANIVDVYSYNDSFEDELGHGTGVASVIIGKTLGISTEATLKNVKIPMGEVIQLSSLLAAFDAVASDKEDDFAVINCSWTIPKSMILDNLVADLRNQGFLVVAAAGNTISNADDLSPVGYDAVLGVGASDAFDRVISWAEGFGSNWGHEVDLFAPGIDVKIATKNGEYTETSGTSISTGIVSSIAAQVMSDISGSSNTDGISVGDIQQLIINNSVEDILFRNEEIYETTPNKLVMALGLNKYYYNELPPVIKINPGEIYTIPFELNEKYVSRINIDNITLGKKVKHHPDWVSLEQSTNTLTISPTEADTDKRYILYIEFYNQENSLLTIYSITFDVGEVPEEVDEKYDWEVGENDNIIINAVFGCAGNSCGGGGIECTGALPNYKSSYCRCSYYGYFGNCYSGGVG
jgi:hypothetical protein